MLANCKALQPNSISLLQVSFSRSKTAVSQSWREVVRCRLCPAEVSLLFYSIGSNTQMKINLSKSKSRKLFVQQSFGLIAARTKPLGESSYFTVGRGEIEMTNHCKREEFRHKHIPQDWSNQQKKAGSKSNKRDSTRNIIRRKQHNKKVERLSLIWWVELKSSGLFSFRWVNPRQMPFV